MMKETNIIEKTFSKKKQQKTIFQKQKLFFKNELKKKQQNHSICDIFKIIKNFEKKNFDFSFFEKKK